MFTLMEESVLGTRKRRSGAPIVEKPIVQLISLLSLDYINHQQAVKVRYHVHYNVFDHDYALNAMQEEQTQAVAKITAQLDAIARGDIPSKERLTEWLTQAIEFATIVPFIPS